MFPVIPMEVPTLYGPFHLIFLIVSTLCAFILCAAFRAGKIHHPGRLIFCFGLFTLLIEIYKQAYLLIHLPYYQVNALPLQFCSMIIYVSLLVPTMKPSKIRSALYNFLALYLGLSGISVMFFPNTVFTGDLILNIHTMLWHGTMVVAGVFAWYIRPIQDVKRSMKAAFTVFITLVGAALVINWLSYHLPLFAYGQATNLWYVGPYLKLSHPIIDAVYAAGGWPLYLLAYVFTFTLGATLLAWLNHLGYRKKLRWFPNPS